MSIGIWFPLKLITRTKFLRGVKPIGSLKEKYFSFKIGWDTSELTLVGDCFIRNVVESRIYGTLVPVECQDHLDLKYILVKPEDLVWRCKRCDKCYKLNEREKQIAETMFKCGNYFGKKIVKEELRKLINSL